MPQTLGVGASMALMEEVILTHCGKNYSYLNITLFMCNKKGEDFTPRPFYNCLSVFRLAKDHQRFDHSGIASRQNPYDQRSKKS